MKNVWKSAGYLLVYFLIQFMMQCGFMMAAALSQGVSTQTGLMTYVTERLLLVTIVSNLLTIGIFCSYFKVRGRKVTDETGLVKVPAGSYILPVELAFSFSFVWALLTYDISFNNSVMLTISENYYSQILPMHGGTILKVLALLVSAPITEEFVCRGIIMKKLQKSYPDRVVILISAVIFGLMHFPAGGAVLALGATLMGAVFGLVYVKTGSLWPAVVAHMFANLPDFILPMFGEMPGVVRWGLMVVFAILFVVCLLRFLKGADGQ